MLAVGVVLGIVPYLIGPYHEWIKSLGQKADTDSYGWKYVSSFSPGGNAEARRFFQWWYDHQMLCEGELDETGNLVRLFVHVCSSPNDAAIERASRLKTLQSLSLRAEKLTDRGLAQIETMPALLNLDLYMADNISDAAISRIRLRRPNLVMTIVRSNGQIVRTE
jgi:hypothetical protein